MLDSGFCEPRSGQMLIPTGREAVHTGRILVDSGRILDSRSAQNHALEAERAMPVGGKCAHI